MLINNHHQLTQTVEVHCINPVCPRDKPCTTWHECWRLCHHRSAEWQGWPWRWHQPGLSEEPALTITACDNTWWVRLCSHATV